MSNLVKTSSAIEKARDNNGDVGRLTEIERKLVYNELCKAYKLDPLSFPLDYVKSKQGLKIYLNAVGAAQLRDRYQISTHIKSREFLEDIWVVVVVASRGDRSEEATGAVSIFDKYGNSTPEDKVNALKKAETQAKRRATLAICGFGWSEEERGTILKAEFHDPPQDVIYQPTVAPRIEPSVTEICKDWKSPADAITWAATQLPNANENDLRDEFNLTRPINGKKAPAWIKRILELKS